MNKFDHIIDIEKTMEVLSLTEHRPGEYSPLVLAYLGDSVYEVYLRTILVNRAAEPVDVLNRKGSFYAKAVTQARIMRTLEAELSEEETAVYKRGRNAKSPTKAKNASVVEYRVATGFEALIGYLYLSGSFERLTELIKRAVEIAESE